MGRRAGVAFLGAMFAGVHLWVGLAMQAPIIQPDELGSLGVARFLAGQGLAPVSADVGPHTVAYGVLLAPVAWLTSSPLAMWRGALAVNAVLAGLTIVLAAALAARLAPTLGERARLMVVTAVGVYPALFLWSNLAITENVAVPAFVAMVLLAWRAWESTWFGAWLATGMAAGVFYAAHPNGIVVPLALGVVALASARPWAEHGRRLGAMALGVTGVAGSAWALARWIIAEVPGTDVVKANRAPGGIGDVAAAAAGQVWYLTVATWGLVPLAAATTLGALVAVVRGSRRDARTATLSLLALSLVAMVVAGSRRVDQMDRIDTLILGRYNEALLVPLLLVGLLSVVRLGGPLRERTRGTLARPAVVIAGTLAISGAGLALGRRSGEIALPTLRSNVLGLDALLVARDFRLSVALFSALGLLAAAAVLVIGRVRPLAAAGVVAALFVPSVLTGQDYMGDRSRLRANERAVALAVRAVDRRLGGSGAGCVGYDVAATSLWHRANYELFLPRVRVAGFSSRRQSPCSNLVISGRPDFDVAFPGSRRVMLENATDQALWALPGAVQDRLGREGWLLPRVPGSPVTPRDRRYRIGPTGSEPVPRVLSMRRGHSREIEVAITHAGHDAAWPSAYGLRREAGAVRVGVRWYRLPVPGRPDGFATLDKTRVELPRTLLPGERITLRVPLETTAGDGPAVPAATYLVRVDVLQEFVAWFEPVGPPFVFEVVVVDRVF